MTTTLWMDGKLVSHDEARANPLANTLHYGTGVFEGIRSYATPTGPRIFRLAEHLERMRQGASFLGIELDTEWLADGCCDALAANELGDAYLRPLTYFESGGLGLDVGKLTERSLVAAIPWTSHLGAEARARGISLQTSTWRRLRATESPALKLCGNYVGAVIAKKAAVDAGYDEALYVDDHGFVCEGAAENIFLVKNQRVTAVKHRDMLPGITRKTIIELANAEERPVTRAELDTADEVFVTGTSAEVTGVNRLDHRDLGVGPVTLELSRLYDAVVRGQTEANRGWLHAA